MVYTFDSLERYNVAWGYAMRVGIEFNYIPDDLVLVVPVHELVYVADMFSQIMAS